MSMVAWPIAGLMILVAEPMQDSAQMAPVPRARDGNVAIRQELCAARKAGTLEVYDLFIARHPDHPLAKIAREERRRLAEGE